MSDVVKFQKPSLDDEIRTAKEFIEGTKGTLEYFVHQRAALRSIRTPLHRHKEGRLLEFLDEHIAECDKKVDEIEESIHLWEKILAVLEQKSS